MCRGYDRVQAGPSGRSWRHNQQQQDAASALRQEREKTHMAMVLQSKVGGDFTPHPEGIHPAVCVDVIDQGMVEGEFQGQRRMVNKVRLFFESEQHNAEGKNCIISKTFTASLHPKAKLAEFLGKWRGRPVLPGESIDLAKLIGVCSTLVISHQQSISGRTYASIDAVSKPTRRVTVSGCYDPVAMRQRIAEWRARDQAAAPLGQRPAPYAANGAGAYRPPTASPAAAVPEPVFQPAATVAPEFDPEVGF